MSKIIRPNLDVKAFASAAPSTERTIFGSFDQSNDLTANLNAEYLRGFGIYGPNDFPTREDFNGANFSMSQLIAYIFQNGISEWNEFQEFHTNGLTNYGGIVYKSLVDNNVGNIPIGGSDQFIDWTLFPASINADIPGDLSKRVISLNSEFFIYIMYRTIAGPSIQARAMLKRRIGDVISSTDTGNTVEVSAGFAEFCRISSSRFAQFDGRYIKLYNVDISTSSVGTMSRFGPDCLVSVDFPSNCSLCNANISASSETESYVYAFNSLIGGIGLYKITSSTQEFVGLKYATPGLNLSIAEMGGYIAVVNRSDDSIFALSVDPSNGNLSPIGIESDLDSFGMIEGPYRATRINSDSVMITNNTTGDLKSNFLSFSGDSFFSSGDQIDYASFGISTGVIGTSYPEFHEDHGVVFINDEATNKIYFLENNGEVGGSTGFWDPVTAIATVEEALAGASSKKLMTPMTTAAVVLEAMKAIYHVGSIYTSESSISPASRFGFGTWERIKARMIIGLDEDDVNYDTPAEQGGAKQLATGSHQLTIPQIPGHAHRFTDRYYIERGSKLSDDFPLAVNREPTPVGYNGGVGSSDTDADNDTFLYITDTTKYSGGAGWVDPDLETATPADPHNHTLALTPYHVAYIWRRVS